MPESVIPALLSAMVDAYQNTVAPDALVSLGYQDSDDPNPVQIVVGDDISGSGTGGVDATGEWADSNQFRVEERGTVTVSVMTWNGDKDFAQASEAAWDVFAACSAYHRASATTALGVDGLVWTRPGGDRRVRFVPYEAAAVVFLVFSIDFYAYLNP